VRIVTGVDADRVSVAADGTKTVHAGDASWTAAEVFVAAGRTPNVDGLGLEECGVKVGAQGVTVDGALRTSVKSIYAAGDVAGRHHFTHAAGYEAARAVRNMFLPGTSRGDLLVPWCTFTDPELAHAGLTEAQARARHGGDAVRVWRQDLAHSDRARTESAAEGELRIVTAKGRIVGAHVLAPAAGELIGELALAIDRKLKLADLANVVHVYPTIALAIQQLAAQAAYAKAERLRWLVRSKAAKP
jgi:pyruvate/2-oxoglutarate dehydrogenase complex dihydrolipoamide dehydrogenase (E3) component